MKKFSQNGKTIVFYQKEGDEKFSFLIENEPELTEQLLANVSNKRVKEKDIRFAVKGIFEKIESVEGKRTITIYKPTNKGIQFCRMVIDPYEELFPRGGLKSHDDNKLGLLVFI